MMHTLLGLVLLFSPQQENILKLEGVGLEMVFPSGWEVKTDGVPPFLAVAQLPPRRAVVMIGKDRENPAEPLDQGKRDMLAGLKQTFSEHVVLKETPFKTDGGVKTEMVAIEGKARDMTLRHLTFLFSGFGDRYSITFAAKEDQYQELEPVFMGIVKTLALKGPKKEDLDFLELAAAKNPDYEKMKKLLEQGANANALNRKGHSSLTVAVVERRAPMVKWLLENGADLNHKDNSISFLRMVASPPILEYIDRKLGKYEEKRKPINLTPEWTSPESAVFFGIHNNRIEYVEEGLKLGADLTALEDNYKLPPLEFTRQLMREYDVLDLDSSKLKPIEDLLLKATQKGS